MNCVLVRIVFFFFFSSRRRHTRSKRDWSSDVCSSDLISHLGGDDVDHALVEIVAAEVRVPVRRLHLERSEERRVGKECRSRWWPDAYIKKTHKCGRRPDERATISAHRQ